MKYTYRFANGDADGIEIADDWGNRILEFDRLDYNTERKDHRTDHKYHAGLPVSLEDAESPEYAQIKRKHGLSKRMLCWLKCLSEMIMPVCMRLWVNSHLISVSWCRRFSLAAVKPSITQFHTASAKPLFPNV